MNKYSVIGSSYRNLLKPIFFKFDPEDVHDGMTSMGNFLSRSGLTRFLTAKTFAYTSPKLVQKVAGLTFNNPIGLSAGFDKNAKLINILSDVGFGFAEIGSITLEAYEGNKKPRLFRLKKSKGLVVYYGLMNEGVRNLLPRFKKFNGKNIMGISVAKTNCLRTSSEVEGINDYYECLKILEQEKVVNYYTINISCPNTFGGEPFTTQEKLEKLLSKLSQLKITKPVFVKMPINLPSEEYDSLLKVCVKYKITGVIIGNLTKVRDPLLIKDQIPEHIMGGISGKPTKELSNELIGYTYKKYGKSLVIIGVGGVFSAADAYEKIKLGASLIQLITGMIFMGPQLIGEINSGLVELLEKDGYTNIEEAIGANNLLDI